MSRELAGKDRAAKAPTRAQRIRTKARELHRCPEGYTGPCWGATAEDVHRAVELVNAELQEEAK